ncbi:MAG: ribosome silencing factor [Muribaculaceae bacterium]|nr:ribosome silencing factor [Muribaculaceae bacterium]
MQEKKDIMPVIIEAIQDKKGQKITTIDFSGIEGASTGGFIICQGRSTSQVSAIADAIREDVFKKTGRKPYNYDGYRNSQWIVIDYGELMIHVFLPDIREFYNLEDLWSDGKINLIPDIE